MGSCVTKFKNVEINLELPPEKLLYFVANKDKLCKTDKEKLTEVIQVKVESWINPLPPKG
jgi:hypothetical protein